MESTKTRTFTTIPIVIYKKVSICGDAEEEKIWKNFFANKKANKYFKKWLTEAYQEVEKQERGLKANAKLSELDIKTYEDIFEQDEDWKFNLNLLVSKMFKKINKTYFPEIDLKDSKQHFIKLKLEQEMEEEMKKENEEK